MNVPDYQPFLMALLFALVWDVSASPPHEVPKYGWWEERDTYAARLWQNHARGQEFNYGASHAFNTDQYGPRVLNGDGKSSRTSFLATFFYLCAVVGHRHMDSALIDRMLALLAEDVEQGEERMKLCLWGQPFWLWCIMFGAALAWSVESTSVGTDRQPQRWRDNYDDKMRLISRVLGIDSWHSARTVLTDVVGSIDTDVNRDLEGLWNNAVHIGGAGFGERTIDPAVIRLPYRDE